MLNISWLCGTSAARHIMANTMGTAPRNPTHERNALSRNFTLWKGINDKNTLNGRVMKIIKKLITSPGIRTGHNSEGLTSSPNVRNINSWHSHDSPSKKLNMERRCTNLEFPTTKPPTYTAR